MRRLGAAGLALLPLAASSPAQAAYGTGACEMAMMHAALHFDVSEPIMRAVGLTEAGTAEGRIHPWAANIDGRAVYYPDQESAARGVEAALRDGAHNVDVGCLQISMAWHGQAFGSIAEAFTPEVNVAYGAALLVALKREKGTWPLAIQFYHSSDPERQRAYLCQVLAHYAPANYRRACGGS